MTPWQRLVGERPIVTRLVLAVAAAMAAVLVLAAAFVYWRVSYALDRQLDQDLDAYQQVVERAVHAGHPPVGDTPGETFQVFDRHGAVVAGNTDIPPLVGADVVRRARVSEQKVDVGRFLPPANLAYRVLAKRVSTPGGERVVAAAISRRKHDEALRELLLQLAIADLLALVAASFVGYRTARAALDPVERYRRAVADMGEDEVGTRLPVTAGREDELSRLGTTLNGLLERIEAGAVRERQFLADASHELRTPLSLMRTELEWARARPRQPEETATVLASLTGQVERLVELANALLDLEELRAAGPIPREEVRVSELLASAVEPTARSGVTVHVDAPEGLARVNRRWLELAIANLVANAARHGAPPVLVSAERGAGTLTVVVEDSGPGFADDFAELAFDRFSRADVSRSSPGSGLGLALVRAVARSHGGDAWIDHGSDGARVRIRLPPPAGR